MNMYIGTISVLQALFLDISLRLGLVPNNL